MPPGVWKRTADHRAKTREASLCSWDKRGRKREARLCDFCHSEFSTVPSLNKRFCSHKCSALARAQRADHPFNLRRCGLGSTDRSTLHKWIKKHFGDRCMICGWAEAPCDVAHLIPRSASGPTTVENTIVLCPNHHRLFDSGKITREAIEWAKTAYLGA